MSWKFVIVNKGTEPYAHMVYDWDKDTYSMEIYENCGDHLDVCPLMLMVWYEKGLRRIGDKECRSFISTRVIPYERQNMGFILRDLGLKFYHECFMLKYQPLSGMDDARLVLVEENPVYGIPFGDAP